MVDSLSIFVVVAVQWIDGFELKWKKQQQQQIRGWISSVAVNVCSWLFFPRNHTHTNPNHCIASKWKNKLFNNASIFIFARLWIICIISLQSISMIISLNRDFSWLHFIQKIFMISPINVNFAVWESNQMNWQHHIRTHCSEFNILVSEKFRSAFSLCVNTDVAAARSVDSFMEKGHADRLHLYQRID